MTHLSAKATDVKAAETTQNKSHAGKFLLAAVGIAAGLWQFWSWGPYEFRIGTLGVTTKDFVVECRYSAKGFHGNTGFGGKVEVLQPGDTITCPRRFIGPFGIGATAWIRHPLFAQQWETRTRKLDRSAFVFTPQPFDIVLAEQRDQRQQRFILTQHVSMLERKYLPVFTATERQVLADLYVERVQSYVRTAGGLHRDSYDQNTLDAIDRLFRE